MRHTVPVKSLDHAMVFLYLNFFSTWQINIEDIKTMKEHIWSYVVNKKSVK